MREDWTETTLGMVTTHFRGTVKVEDGIPYPASGVMMEGRGLINREPFIGGVSGYKKLTPIAPGQLVLRSITAWEAPITVVPVGYLGRHVSGVFPVLNLDESQLNPGFMRLICQWPVFWNEMRMRATGSVLRRKTLSANQLQQIPLNLPPLEGQKRIVDVVSSVDAYIDALQQQADTARTARNAVLYDLLSAGGKDWTETTINKISENLSSRRIPITKSDRKSGDIPYYGASGIVDYVDGFIFDERTLLVSEDGANLIARSTPIAFSAFGKYWVNNHAHVLRFNEFATQQFVEFYLNKIRIDEWVTGAAQPKLNQKSLNEIPILLPPIEEQKRIVEIVSSMDEVIQSTEHAVTDAKNLRAGLLSDLLSGEHEIPASYDSLLGAA